MNIKLGDTVRQIMPAPVQGVVTRKTFDDGLDKFQYFLKDAAGEEHYFDEGEIELVPATDATPATPGAAA